MDQKYKNFGIVADKTDHAQQTKKDLIAKYNLIDLSGNAKSKDIDVIIAVGGDGFMLETLHMHIEDGIPVYGLNRGSIGFLLNEYSDKNLLERINNAVDSHIHPLEMKCTTIDGQVIYALAINEVSILRTTGQAAKTKIKVDGITHLDELISDGILVATPAGSSAYNYSNGGMILPIGSNLLSITPISPFRPRRWRGGLLPNTARIEFEVLKFLRRPVKAMADNYEVEDVTNVVIRLDTTRTIHLLFDKGHSLEERIIKEIFEVC